MKTDKEIKITQQYGSRYFIFAHPFSKLEIKPNYLLNIAKMILTAIKQQ